MEDEFWLYTLSYSGKKVHSAISYLWSANEILVLNANAQSPFINSKLTFSRNSYRKTIRVSNGLDPDQDQHYVGPDLGPNCLQRLSEDNKPPLARNALTLYPIETPLTLLQTEQTQIRQLL